MTRCGHESKASAGVLGILFARDVTGLEKVNLQDLEQQPMENVRSLPASRDGLNSAAPTRPLPKSCLYICSGGAHMKPSVAKLDPILWVGCHVMRIVPSTGLSRYVQKKGDLSLATSGALISHLAASWRLMCDTEG